MTNPNVTQKIPVQPIAPQPLAVPHTPRTHPAGPVGWLEEHFVPGFTALAHDAELARMVLPQIAEYLPRLAAALHAIDPALNLGPLAAEAEQILALIP